MSISYEECKKHKTYYFIIGEYDFWGAYESFNGADNRYDEVLANDDKTAIMFKVMVAKTPLDERKRMERYYRREAFFEKHPICKKIYRTYIDVWCWCHRKVYWFLYDRGLIK